MSELQVFGSPGSNRQRRQIGSRERAGQQTLRYRSTPTDQLQRPIEMLDDGRAGIDPVAAIDVGQPPDVANLRPVDMAADDPIQPPLAGMVDRRLFKIENEIQG